MKKIAVDSTQNLTSFVFIFKNATVESIRTVYPAKTVYSAIFPVKL
jgi:hypothetical protein